MAISAVLVAYNAEYQLERVVGRLRDFDEIVVVDNESTDNTRALAESLGCRVVSFPHGKYHNSDPARAFAIQSARSEWVLMVDSDELITPELSAYLKRFITRSGDICGLRIPRMNYILHTWRRSTYPDYQLRFFKKEFATWPQGCHGGAHVNGRVENIPARRHELALRHMSASLHTNLDRINRHSSIEVNDSENRRSVYDRHVNLWRIYTEPLGLFLHSYLLRGAIRFGVSGFISAAHDALYRYVCLAKKHESEIQDKCPAEIRELLFEPPQPDYDTFEE